MPIKSDSRDTRSTAKRLRMLRAVIVQQAWLSWPLVWTGQRLEYTDGKESIFPDTELIARTQRQLNRIYEQGELATKLLNDPEEWKRKQLELLSVAKYIATLTKTDFLELEKGARNKNAKVVKSLLNLIATEAMVTNSLPRSPVHLLVRTGEAAESDLRSYAQSYDKPRKARALAALALGRIHADMLGAGALSTKQIVQAGQFATRSQKDRKETDWLATCYRWGLDEPEQERAAVTKGTEPEDPAVVVEFLHIPNGAATLRKLLSANRRLIHMKLSIESIKSISRTTKPDTICDIIEELQNLDKVAREILNYRKDLDAEEFQYDRHSRKSSLEVERTNFVADLKKTSHELILKAPLVEPVRQLHKLLSYLTSTYKTESGLMTEMLKLARNAPQLKPSMAAEYFSILNQYAVLFWEARLPKCPKCGGSHLPEAEPEETALEPQAAQESSTESAKTQSTETTSADEPAAVEKQLTNIPQVATTLPVLNPLTGFLNVPLTNYVYTILKGTSSPSLARQIIDTGIIKRLSHKHLKQAEYLPLLVDWIERIDLERWLSISQLFEVVDLFPDLETAREYLEPFIQELENAPFSTRAHFFETLDEVVHEKKSIKRSVSTVTRFLPYLIALTKDENPDDCSCVSIMESAMEISKQAPHLETELFTTLCDVLKTKRPFKWRTLNQVKPACLMALAHINTFAGKSKRKTITVRQKRSAQVILRQCLETFMVRRSDCEGTFVEAGLRALNDYPVLCQMVFEHYKLHGNRTEKFVERLGIARKFGPESMKGLDKLARYEPAQRLLKTAELPGRAGIERHMLKRLYAKGWNEIITLAPAAVPYAASYICSRNIVHNDQSPPDTLMRLLETRSRTEKERNHLRQLVLGQPDNVNLKKRLENLERRLEDGVEVEDYTRKLILKQMRHLATEAEIEAFELVMKEVFVRQLKRIVGTLPERVHIDSYLINALLLTQDVQTNKRLLKKLIHAHVTGDTTWRHRIEANRACLAALAARGTNVDAWLAPHSKSYKVEGVEGESVTFTLETDPIKILEMGNYFDTCLGFLGVNSFSTVVNACDLNKRVVYARDKMGRVICRKLIGIDEEGKLVGFRTYISVPIKPVRTRLNSLMVQYLREFAERCNLELGEPGSDIPTLTSKVWYDDGLVSWQSEPAPVRNGKGSQN